MFQPIKFWRKCPKNKPAKGCVAERIERAFFSTDLAFVLTLVPEKFCMLLLGRLELLDLRLEPVQLVLVVVLDLGDLLRLDAACHTHSGSISNLAGFLKFSI